MWRLSHVLLKAFGPGLGLVCLYAAVFLYRDEREQVQNHLEDWWQKIRNKQATALLVAARSGVPCFNVVPVEFVAS
jgi:hypothetical protein